MTLRPAELSSLSACARGEMSLAVAQGIPVEALSAARWLASRAAAAGRHDVAWEIVTGCLALEPKDERTLCLAAALALHRGDARTAHNAARQAHALAPVRNEMHYEAAFLVARALVASNQVADAGAWLLLVEDDLAAPERLRISARALRRHLSAPSHV